MELPPRVRGAEVDRPWISDDYYPRDEDRILREHRAVTTYSPANRKRTNEDEWNCPRLYSTASEFLRENRTWDNFFLWVDCFDPHGPVDCPPEYMKMYDDTPGRDGSIGTPPLS